MSTHENSEEKIQQETCGSESSDAKENSQTREITQTDHLNRRLLDAFLLRLNSCTSSELEVVYNIEQIQINNDINNFEDGQDIANGDQTVENAGKC